MNSLFDIFVSFGEGGKRLSKFLSNNLSNLNYNGWQQPHIPTIALNFSNDATDIIVEDELVEDMGGSGRIAEKAISYYNMHRDRIRGWIWDNLNKTIPQRLWVTACLGGGVGTGSVGKGLTDVLEWIDAYKDATNNEYNPTIYLLLTLPKGSEGAKLKRTAFVYLNDLITKFIKTGIIKATLLIDNGTAENLYGSEKGEGMWANINKGILEAVKKLYLFPMRDDVDWSAGYKRFDFEDLLTTLSYGNGFLDIRKAVLSRREFEQYIQHRMGKEDTKPPEVKTNSLVCSSHDINTTKRLATIVGLPKEWKENPDLQHYSIDFVDYVIRCVTRKARCNDFINTNYTDESLDQLEATIICSGMPLSQKIYRMVQTIVKDLSKDRIKQEVSELDLSVFDDLGV